jgi:hypothetical protein
VLPVVLLVVQLMVQVAPDLESAPLTVLALEQKIVELQQMQQSLRRLVSQCHGDERPDCPILDELATEKSEKSGKKGCHDGGG